MTFFNFNDMDFGLPSVVLAQAEQPTPPGLSSMLPGLIAIMVFFYFLILRPQKNKEQALRNMVTNLKEKDRVVTIGGIHGVVTNGTKVRVDSSAISRVIIDETKTES
jgi:preprotein translocase subunit YajC